MRTIAYTGTVKRSEWRLEPGDWDGEPDKIQYQCKETGLPCLIVRNRLGALCGYVGVTEEHPWFKRDYFHDIEKLVEVHGGITYSAFCQEDEDGICHIPDEGEPDRVWWFGFDCAHYGDDYPKDKPSSSGSVYRNVEYVQGEILSMARQILAAKENE